jgi:hypothetical protein
MARTAFGRPLRGVAFDAAISLCVAAFALAAVGLTRGRMRAMLAVEAVLMAGVGALLGIGLGAAVSAGAMGFLNGMSRPVVEALGTE